MRVTKHGLFQKTKCNECGGGIAWSGQNGETCDSQRRSAVARSLRASFTQESSDIILFVPRKPKKSVVVTFIVQ